MGFDVGANLVDAAHADRLQDAEPAGASRLLLRTGFVRRLIHAADRVPRGRAGTAIAEIGFVRHQEGDKSDSEDRAKDHAGTPFSYCAPMMRARPFPAAENNR
jgi:hypothetical protein